jgi:hypothetical protein
MATTSASGRRSSLPFSVKLPQFSDQKFLFHRTEIEALTGLLDEVEIPGPLLDQPCNCVPQRFSFGND